jgi:glycosyltransferase involved in cell wall biosynthesis
MEPRHNVMMVTDTLEVGGAEQVAVDVANTLDRSRFEVHFCASRFGGPLEANLRDDVDVTILGRSATWDLRKLLAFGRLVRNRRIDVLHSHGRGTMRFVALCKVLGLVSARHVFHDHFGRMHLDRSAGPLLELPLHRGVDQYIGVDSRLCRWAVDTVGLPEGSVHLVRSGVDVERFDHVEPVDLRTAFDLGDVDLAMVMVANFRPQKDHPTLFRALAELPEEDRERLRVVIAGSTTADPAYFDACMAMLDRLGISHLIRAVGVRDDAPALLAGADAGVFSSKNESGPLVLLEYMASGLPFVATETGEIAHAVRDAGVGLLTEPRDHLALAGALSDLLDMSTERRHAMGARGRELASGEFSQRSVTRRVESIYDRLLRDPASSPSAEVRPAGQ